jgi:hypothetical protein
VIAAAALAVAFVASMGALSWFLWSTLTEHVAHPRRVLLQYLALDGALSAAWIALAWVLLGP